MKCVERLGIFRRGGEAAVFVWGYVMLGGGGGVDCLAAVAPDACLLHRSFPVGAVGSAF